jgi:hypothetical protein
MAYAKVKICPLKIINPVQLLCSEIKYFSSALSQALVTGMSFLETQLADMEVVAILSSSTNSVPILTRFVVFLDKGLVWGSGGPWIMS